MKNIKLYKNFESEKYRDTPKFKIGDKVKVNGEIDEREFNGNRGTIKGMVVQRLETNMSWIGECATYTYNGMTYRVVFDEIDPTYDGDDSHNTGWWCSPWNMIEIEKSNIKEEDRMVLSYNKYNESVEEFKIGDEVIADGIYEGKKFNKRKVTIVNIKKLPYEHKFLYTLEWFETSKYRHNNDILSRERWNVRISDKFKMYKEEPIKEEDIEWF